MPLERDDYDAAPQANTIRTLPTPHCPMCGSLGDVAYADLSDRFFGVDGRWNLRECDNANCGLLWLDPMPVADDIAKLYRNYLTHGPTPKLAVTDAFVRSAAPLILGYSRTSNRLWERILGRLITWMPPLSEMVAGKMMWLPASKQGRLLDVGCGNGSFLEDARRFGWQVVGVEPDPVSSDYARSQGLDVRTGLLAAASFPDESFDVVTMSHVIEHLPDPIATLKECRRILRPSGWVVMLTPNTESLGRRRFGRDWLGLDAPRHLMLFNRSSMRRLVTVAGFQCRELTTKSRLAYITYAAGKALERAKTIPGLRLRPAPWLDPFRISFHIREYLASRARPRGEELFVVGEK